ncbi:hypothetical protein BDV95DRAFT_481603 [Massariosphaeria phaeospora]|uniref:Uncharacterized protein n=1 Tax=Massariosphaeria phaeospora TaxID=100035 RepID=A0A7C8IDL9_9PLEO|nr:hypothetical protein BDV95DRAFT_481603 [Massariosphaeria phaeospora]
MAQQHPDQYDPYSTSKDTPAGSSTPRLPPARSAFVSWILELVAVGFSIVAHVAIIVILNQYNGKPLAAWSSAVSLNTVIATLGTVARTTLAFAVGACIGQQKWSWLRKRNDSLVAFERFDEASKGPMGGTKLLFWLKLRHWATLGALVTVGTVAFDPFLQAVISSTGRLVDMPLNAECTIGQASKIDIGKLFIAETGPEARVITTAGNITFYGVTTRSDFGLTGSVYNGFQDAAALVSFQCATGNCTWPTYSSAAVCSSCVDVGHHLKRVKGSGDAGSSFVGPTNIRASGDYTSFSLPYANLTNYDGRIPQAEVSELMKSGESMLTAFVVSNTTNIPEDTVAFQNMETLLISFATIKSSDEWRNSQVSWEDSTPSATECALYLCSNVYESVDREGVLKERIINSWANRDPESWEPESHCSGNPECAKGFAEKVSALQSEWGQSKGLATPFWKASDLRLVIPPEESAHLPENLTRQFNITHTAVKSTMDFLRGFASLAAAPSDSTKNQMAYPAYHIDIMPPVIDTLWASTNLTTTFENLARSITTHLRNVAPDRHRGTVQSWVFHFKVNWAFLAFPLAMLLLGIVYVLLTIIEATRLHLPIWKEGLLPVLLHGFDDATQSLLRGLELDPKSGQQPSDVKVRFDATDYKLRMA